MVSHSFNNIINLLLVFSIILAISFSFYHYYYQQDYNYRVEALCDPSIENCFYRECDINIDACLPNKLSYYKVFILKAYDFPKCADNSCKSECESGKMICKQVSCNRLSDDQCVS